MSRVSEEINNLTRVKNTMEVSTKEGKYIYCIIPVKEPKTFGPLGIGGRGEGVYTICFNGIGAVVSNSPIIKYSASRENFLAHEEVIEKVMKSHTVLPVRFCTIAEDENKIKLILEKEYHNFESLLEKMKGKVELGIKVIFKENIFEEILKNFPQIRQFKEKIAAKPAQATYYERIELGKMVEDTLEEEKEKYKTEILDVLAPLAFEMRTNNTYGERMILNAAFLVEVKREQDFDNKVNQLQDLYESLLRFKYVHTPPFNFVNLVIDTGKY